MGSGRGRAGGRVAVRGRRGIDAARLAWPLVAALTVAAFVLRAAQIDQSLFGDELYLYDIATLGSLGDVLSDVHETESTPPLHFLLAWLSIKLTDPELGMRLPSLLAGTALVPAVFALGRRTVGPRAGLAGAAIVAIAPYGLMYGVEGRAYALLGLLSCGSTLALLAALERGGRWRWAGFAALTAAILYTHYTGVFVVVAQGAWAAWRHRASVRALALSYAAVAVAYLPWIPSFLVQRQDSAAVRIEEGYDLTPATAAAGLLKVVPGHPYFELHQLPGTIWVVLFVAALAGAAGYVLWRVRPAWPRGGPVELLVVLALATPVCALLYSLGPESVYLPRGLMSSLPAAVMLAGALIVRAGRVVGTAAAVVVFVVLTAGAVQTFQGDYQRPPYRAAAEWVESRGDPGDVVFSIKFGDERSLTPALPLHLDDEYLYAEVGGDEAAGRARAAERGRLFFVVPQVGALQGDPLPPVPGLRIVDQQTFPGFSDVAVFEFAAAG